MLQVPCLSPPIYGHSHYKKFWLRQTAEVGGSSSTSTTSASAAAAAAAVSCEMKSSSTSTTTASSPDISSSGKQRICGKRRPSLRGASAAASSPLKVTLNVESELWKQRKEAGDQVSPLSTVDDTAEEGEEEEITPKSVLDAAAAAADDHEFILSEEEADPAKSSPPPAEAVINNPQQQPDSQTAVDCCLTSKCNEDSRHDDDPEDLNSSDSDSATSSTSQASDHDEDARSHSVKSSFRQYLKRQSKQAIKTGEVDQQQQPPQQQQIEKQVSSGFGSSPKTRAASSSAHLACSDLGSPVSLVPSSINNNNSMTTSVSTRTCKHCGTMKTPLWRNGPLGPKSLCNACGIRLRKARRNNNNEGGGGAGGGGGGSQSSTAVMKRKMSQAEASSIMNDFSRQHPYKKSRLPVSKRDRDSQLGQIMRLLPQVNSSSASDKFHGRTVSKDEEEGAVLLMALSCGLVLA